MTSLWQSLRMFLWLTVLTGLIYPLLITGIAQLTAHHKANGDFILLNDKVVGARLIAQKFANPKYFWPRPSSADYNPLQSGGSNLGPTSLVLKKTVEERKALINQANKLDANTPIPSELLFASGSSLDPHISPKTAEFQISRIVTARGWNEKEGKEAVQALINKMTTGPEYGMFGAAYLNVLELNLALDQLTLNPPKTPRS